MLIKDAKVFYVKDKDCEKPDFSRRPTVFVTPISKDVEQVSVQFTERWALIGTGGNGELEECLCFSDSCEDKSKNIFEVSFKLAVPCHFYGSNDKSGWHGIAIRRTAEDKVKGRYWKDLGVAKSSPRNRFDKKPFRYSPE